MSRGAEGKTRAAEEAGAIARRFVFGFGRGNDPIRSLGNYLILSDVDQFFDFVVKLVDRSDGAGGSFGEGLSMLENSINTTQSETELVKYMENLDRNKGDEKSQGGNDYRQKELNKQGHDVF